MGFRSTGKMWREQMLALSDIGRLVAVDLPGFGQSPGPTPPSLADLGMRFIGRRRVR